MFNYQDWIVLILYGAGLLAVGLYFSKSASNSQHFMTGNRSIPSWAAGLAVMSAYTSSISYIATPGKAFDENWHPLIFALCIFPVAWLAVRYAIPAYRRMNLVSVYEFLEQRLGSWASGYAAGAFSLYMISRVAVVLYLSALLLHAFTPIGIEWLIVGIGIITIAYTMLGGLEAVVWTDVMQSVLMIGGLLFCCFLLFFELYQDPNQPHHEVWQTGKFSLGSTNLTLSERSIWVMILYGLTENLRNLLADQNYVQKYCATTDVKQSARSLWLAMGIYIPLTVMFLWVGTSLFAFYNLPGNSLPGTVVKGDQVFPHFIAHELPAVLRGLMVAAILAAGMSTIDSALNSTATVLLRDLYLKFYKPQASEALKMNVLRLTTIIWGILGTSFALWMVNVKSALDVWWQLAGIFGGGILGLFALAFWNKKIAKTKGILAITISLAFIAWATFAKGLPARLKFLEFGMDPILIGTFGTLVLIGVHLILAGIWKDK